MTKILFLVKPSKMKSRILKDHLSRFLIRLMKLVKNSRHRPTPSLIEIHSMVIRQVAVILLLIDQQCPLVVVWVGHEEKLVTSREIILDPVVKIEMMEVGLGVAQIGEMKWLIDTEITHLQNQIPILGSMMILKNPQQGMC